MRSPGGRGFISYSSKLLNKYDILRKEIIKTFAHVIVTFVIVDIASPYLVFSAVGSWLLKERWDVATFSGAAIFSTYSVFIR